jgi:hypothetical protein
MEWGNKDLDSGGSTVNSSGTPVRAKIDIGDGTEEYGEVMYTTADGWYGIHLYGETVEYPANCVEILEDL